jgi:hypothetical protein
MRGSGGPKGMVNPYASYEAPRPTFTRCGTCGRCRSVCINKNDGEGCKCSRCGASCWY